MSTQIDEVEPQPPRSGCWNGLAALMVASAVMPLTIFIASQLGRFLYVCELISNFQLFIFISLLPFPLLLLLMRCWAWAVTLSIATIWSGVLVTQVYWPVDQPPPGEQVVRIMSYNVFGANWNFEAAVTEIVSQDPDVLVVCEYTRNWHDILQVLYDDYPHRLTLPRWHGFGIAVLSKIPIDSHEVLQLGTVVDKNGKRQTVTDNPVPVVNLKFGQRTVRLVGFHSLSPMNQQRMTLRNQQFADLGKFLAKKDVPTILVGDLNCTTWSYFLKKDLLKRARLFDSRQGIGYQGTWRADLKPFTIPIDHALVSRHIHVHDRWTGNRGGSDHLPIIVEVSVSPSEPSELVE